MLVKRGIYITMATEEVSNLIIEFLNNCGIVCQNLNDLDGVIVPREVLLSEKRYISAKEQLPKLRSIFSSSYMTSLQSNATEMQTWPLINLVRQILKMCNKKMRPLRMANGYSKDGKKKYKRAFLIEKDNVFFTET